MWPKVAKVSELTYLGHHGLFLQKRFANVKKVIMAHLHMSSISHLASACIKKQKSFVLRRGHATSASDIGCVNEP
jgi:hypothetical protein